MAIVNMFPSGKGGNDSILFPFDIVIDENTTLAGKTYLQLAANASASTSMNGFVIELTDTYNTVSGVDFFAAIRNVLNVLFPSVDYAIKFKLIVTKDIYTRENSYIGLFDVYSSTSSPSTYCYKIDAGTTVLKNTEYDIEFKRTANAQIEAKVTDRQGNVLGTCSKTYSSATYNMSALLFGFGSFAYYPENQ